MGWKTGLHSFGAHYLTSIAKNANPIENLVPGWYAATVVQREVGEWLRAHAGPHLIASELATKIRKAGAVTGLLSEDGHRLSIAQWCDRTKWDRIKSTLTDNETLHVLAHSGPGHH